MCLDPSHDTRCVAWEAPTRPRARLRPDEFGRNKVFLALEWAPHIGLDAFHHDTDRPIPAVAAREVFRRDRQGPAEILFPSYPSLPLPEMACYRARECRCISYGGADGGALLPGPFQDCNGQRELRDHRYFRFGFSARDMEAYTTRHRPSDAAGGVCLVTTYVRNVPLFPLMPAGVVNPSHAWLHAMDPDTYPRQPQSHDLPLCKEVTCMNYYKRPRSYQCFGGPRTIDHPCTCVEEREHGGE